MGDITTRLRPRKTRSAVVAALAVAAFVAVPSTAFGQAISPTDDEYSSTLEVISQGEQNQPPSGDPSDPSDPVSAATASDDSADALPFTGLEVGGLLAAAAVLGAAGLIMRRLARDRSTGAGA
jgi:hypothetical protein